MGGSLRFLDVAEVSLSEPFPLAAGVPEATSVGLAATVRGDLIFEPWSGT